MQPNQIPPPAPKGTPATPTTTSHTLITTPVANPVTSAITPGTTLPPGSDVHTSIDECRVCVQACDDAIRGGIITSINECVGACNQCSTMVLGQLNECIRSAGGTSVKCYDKITAQIHANLNVIDAFTNTLPMPAGVPDVRGTPAPGGGPPQPAITLPPGSGSGCPVGWIGVQGEDGSTTCHPPVCAPGDVWSQDNLGLPGSCVPEPPPVGYVGPPGGGGNCVPGTFDPGCCTDENGIVLPADQWNAQCPPPTPAPGPVGIGGDTLPSTGGTACCVPPAGPCDWKLSNCRADITVSQSSGWDVIFGSLSNSLPVN